MTESEPRPIEDKGGLHITSEGTVNALIIFVQFSDDTDQKAGWPLTNPPALPSWADTIIGTGHGITQYYDEMSNGIYNFTGDVYPDVYVPIHDQNSYNSIGEVNYEVLTALDSEIDYSLYDNWDGFDNKPDGVMDMVIIIYRNTNLFTDYSGMARLLLSPSNLTLDGISFQYMSGIHLRSAMFGYEYTMYATAHEVGHYLLGGDHIYFISNLGLMTYGPTWNDDRGMHSWERMKLDWIDYQDKTSDDIIWVEDYMTTDDVYRIPIYSSPDSSKYYVIEHRSGLSRHDYARDNGIYVYSILDTNENYPGINVECADGNFDFLIDSVNHKVYRTTPNREGYDEMNFWVDGYSCIPPYYHEDAAWGDNEDAFDLVFNNVFSPASNPSSENIYNVDFTVEVKEYNSYNNQYKLQLYFSNPYAGTPSKPQNLRIEVSKRNHPLLRWDANLETDITHYKIYKSQNGVNFSYLAQTSGLYYQDFDEDVAGGSGMNQGYRYYVVTACDNQYESVFSENERIRVQLDPPDKSSPNQLENDIPETYSLSDNYPNPFNPSTNLMYQIPEAGFVTLKVYDVLGKEVAVLVHERKEAGFYQVSFDAGNLQSGLYIYQLKANNYTSAKKMLFLK